MNIRTDFSEFNLKLDVSFIMEHNQTCGNVNLQTRKFDQRTKPNNYVNNRLL